MTEKESLIAQAKEQNVELVGTETVKQLKEMLGTNSKDASGKEDGTDASNVSKKFDGEANPHRPKQKGGEEDAAAAGTEADTRALLKAQPKRRVFVPKTPGATDKSMFSVNVNGYRFDLQEGQYHDVPETIAELVENHQKATGQAFVDPVSPETGKPLNLDLAPEETKKALDNN